MPSDKVNRSHEGGREERQLMGRIIDEMVRGYAKGYLFCQMVVGCFFLLLFAVFVGTVLVLLVTSSLQGGGHKKTSQNETRSAEKVWREFGKERADLTLPLPTSKRIPLSKVKIGQLVVLVDDVDGVEAGREGCIMGMRDEMLTVGCQTSERLQLVVAHPWQLLLREHFHRLSAREGGVNWDE